MRRNWRSWMLLCLALSSLACLSAGYGIHSGDTREVLPETRIQDTQRLASRPQSSNSIAQTPTPRQAPPRAPPALPYKSLPFFFTGSTQPECQVTKCSAWDWTNHTHSYSADMERRWHHDAAPLPPFVANLSYVPGFTCYSNFLQWAADTTTAFDDPVPRGNIVEHADFILTGTFVCDSPSTEFNIIFQGNPISLYPIVLNGTTYPQDCSCPVCAQNITIPTLSVPGTGLQGYGYDAVNQFSFLILNGSMCLNSVEVRLYYQPRLPVIARIFPGGGPTSGGTNVSISLDNFDPKYNYSCNIPAGTFPATKFSEENRVECTTPKPCSTGPGRVIFNVLMDTPRGQLSAGSQPWTIYADPVIKQISPSSALPGERIFITGNNLNSQPELSWLCRVDNLVSPFAISNGSYVLCEIPTTSRTGLEARVEVSLNGVDWSNSGKIYVASAVIPAHQPTKWYEMPKLLYIILGSIAGLLLLIILAFVAYRFTCGKKASESSQLLADEDIEPLLRGGPTEHNSYGPRTPSTRNELATIVSSFEKIDVSKLKLGKRIGKGSFGEVYAGHYLGTEVAVKKILTSKISPEFTQEFAREASLMRDLRHPNVVQFIGAALEEPDICIVTEYMSQGSLYHLLHDPKVLISWEMVRKIALDAARGMAYLHLRTPAIIHRDLKSHNLLVDSNWKVKVCDFGLSRIAVDLHKTMTACGTPCWTAPEILRNARYTTKADVFSYGIVLWELVTRDEPFAGMPAFQVIFAVGTKGVRLPLPTVCPPELIKLITSCWQEDPALRPPFSDIITYLERLNFAAPAPAAD